MIFCASSPFHQDCLHELDSLMRQTSFGMNDHGLSYIKSSGETLGEEMSADAGERPDSTADLVHPATLIGGNFFGLRQHLLFHGLLSFIHKTPVAACLRHITVVGGRRLYRHQMEWS